MKITREEFDEYFEQWLLDEHHLYNNNGRLYSIGSGDMEEDFDLGQLWDYYEPEFRITAQLEYTEVI